MRLFGQLLEHGIDPEAAFRMSRWDRLIYSAVLELNGEQRHRELTSCIYNALVMFWNDIHKGNGE